MCNCGCDTHISDEANDLKKKAVRMAAGAAAMAGLPAVLATGVHAHHALYGCVIAVQVVMLVQALRLTAQRKRLLRDAAAL